MWNFDQSIQAAMRRGGHNPTDIEVSQIQKLIVNIYVECQINIVMAISIYRYMF